MGPNQRVRFNLISGDLRVEHFNSTHNRFLTWKTWQEWIENFERQLRFFNIRDASDRKDALLIFGGNEITRLDKWLPDPRGQLDDYEKVKKKLNDYYVPQINKFYARYVFCKLRPKPRERIMTYYIRLREQSYECDFGDSCEDRILEHLIQTVRNTQLIQKCLRKEWTLFHFLQEAKKTEDIREQMCYMGNDVSKACGYCGLFGVHPRGWACPAFGKRCYRCNKIDHFAVVCRTKLERKHNMHRRYNDKPEDEYMGDRLQRNKRHRTDNLNNNIIPTCTLVPGQTNGHHQETGQLITKERENEIKLEIKCLQKEVEIWKSNYKLLRKDLVKTQRELRILNKDKHFSRRILKNSTYVSEDSYISRKIRRGRGHIVV